MGKVLGAFALALAAWPCAAAAQPPSGSPAEPVAGAADWSLLRRLPGVPGLVCVVRSEGPETNTSLVLNDDRLPILMLGRRDWSGLSGDAQVSLSIDGAPAFDVEAGMMHNLVIVGPLDAALVQRLAGARTVDWTLPFGRFRAGVAGLGAALEALRACRPDPAG